MTNDQIVRSLVAVWAEINKRIDCDCEQEPVHDHDTPAPSGWVKADSITPISSGANMNDWLQNVRDGGPAGSDPVGAFRFNANTSHLSYDDPIVHPGKPGAAHLHHFFGNRTTDAFSTYESLRANPHSTTDTDFINGSAYWMPALLDGKGNVVNPKMTFVYYKSHPKSNPPHPDAIGIGMPAGMRFLLKGPGIFDLIRNGDTVKGFASLRELSPILEAAQTGDVIGFALSSHQFWDGLHIDSPDHVSHLSKTYSAEFPYYIPELTLKPFYEVLEGDDPTLWHLSSDMDAPAGSTLHGDYIEAWEPSIRQTWQDVVIDGHLSTSNGNLGNGKQGKPWSGFSRAQRPHLIPVPQP